MILLKNRDRNPSFKKGEYIEINDAGNYPMELSVDGVCEQETTQGYNVLDLSKKPYNESSSTLNGATITENGGILTVDTTNATDIVTIRSKWEVYTSQNSILLPKGSYYTKLILNAVNLSGKSKGQLNGNFTLDEDCLITQWFYNIAKGQKDVKLPLLISNDQTKTEYEPYTGGQPSPSPDYPQPISTIENSLKITSCNKNLFNSNLKKGGRLFSNGNYFSANNYIHNEQPLKVIGGRTYTISAKGYNSSIEAGFVFFKDGKFVSSIKQKSTTVTIPNDVNELYYDFSLGSSTIIDIDSFSDYQLELGPAATDYEQHLETQIEANLPEGEFVGKINDTYKDTLNVAYKDDGHYHLILNKMVGKVVLDGSENWKKGNDDQQTSNTNLFYLDSVIVIPKIKGITNILSDKFLTKNVVGVINDFVGICGAVGLNNIIYIRINQQLTTEEFKIWLSNNNTEVYYALATPYEVELGVVDTLLSYDEVTNVFSDSDLYPVINAKYYKDFEFDKILRSGYNIDEQEYEIAKKQMANGKRKRILSSYDDCIIKINLGLLDNKTYQEYKEQLNDGEFHYWSYKYNQYKKANFILTKPSITTEYAYDDDIGIDDIEITLEKSSDVS